MTFWPPTTTHTGIRRSDPANPGKTDRDLEVLLMSDLQAEKAERLWGDLRNALLLQMPKPLHGFEKHAAELLRLAAGTVLLHSGREAQLPVRRGPECGETGVCAPHGQSAVKEQDWNQDQTFGSDLWRKLNSSSFFSHHLPHHQLNDV